MKFGYARVGTKDQMFFIYNEQCKVMFNSHLGFRLAILIFLFSSL